MKKSCFFLYLLIDKNTFWYFTCNLKLSYQKLIAQLPELSPRIEVGIVLHTSLATSEPEVPASEK